MDLAGRNRGIARSDLHGLEGDHNSIALKKAGRTIAIQPDFDHVYPVAPHPVVDQREQGGRGYAASIGMSMSEDDMNRIFSNCPDSSIILR